MEKSFTIAVIAILAAIVAIFIYIEMGNGPTVVSDEFAKCLTSKGAAMYGAYWCSACREQKNIFGSAFQYVNYIECDPKGSNANPELCTEKNIERFPTWIIDNVTHVGILRANELGGLTGCSLS